MLRILRSLFIVVFFGVMMTLLVRDHVIPSLSRGEGIAVDQRVLLDSWVDQDEWLAISLAGAPLGAMRTTAEREDDGTYTAAAHLELRSPLLKGRLLSAMKLNRRLEVESARMRVAMSPPGQPTLSAATLDAPEPPPGAYELLALIRGTSLSIRLSRDDARRFLVQSIARPLTIADSIAPILRGQMLTQGTVYTIDLYDPLMGGGAGAAQIEWTTNERWQATNGEPAQTLRRVEVRAAGMRTSLLVDMAGNIVRREIPLFLPTPGAPAAAAQVPLLVLERRDTPAFRAQFPELEILPAPPAPTAADFIGTDTGELFPSIGILSLFGARLSTPNNAPQGTL